MEGMKFIGSIRRTLRRLIPLSRSSCLVLICGFSAAAAKMFVEFPLLVAFLIRLRFLLSTLPVS